eukprot:Phypoly_transcript_18883.p1 GENE.Phypoly_transcript_18883~~Phypoly_transcript_18883.p1  ORF type:complete len:100 (-),score=5.24 Phypoly_transcript_18883:77-376(-)
MLPVTCVETSMTKQCSTCSTMACLVTSVKSLFWSQHGLAPYLDLSPSVPSCSFVTRSTWHLFAKKLLALIGIMYDDELLLLLRAAGFDDIWSSSIDKQL